MSQTIDKVTVWPLRTLPKDIGVAVVVLVALGLGLILRNSVEGGTKTFRSASQDLSIAYPATWRTSSVTDTVLLMVEDPQTSSAYKSNITVEARELDTSAPPTMQELIDRRVVQRDGLTAYHFLSSAERSLAGMRAAELSYAYVVQPIDTIGSTALPVVAQGREYILIAKNRAYYITLSAPESDYNKANNSFDQMLQTVKIQ